MNASEGRALNWLKKKGYKNIAINKKAPHFQTDSGFFDVRRGYINKFGDCVILLSSVDRQRFRVENISILVYIDSEDPFDIIRPVELEAIRVRRVVFHDVSVGKKNKVYTCVSDALYKDIQRLVNKGEYDSISSFLRVAAMRLVEKHETPILT